MADVSVAASEAARGLLWSLAARDWSRGTAFYERALNDAKRLRHKFSIQVINCFYNSFLSFYLLVGQLASMSSQKSLLAARLCSSLFPPPSILVPFLPFFSEMSYTRNEEC